MRVFITGARGAIGRELADQLERVGALVTRFSRNADSLHQSLDSLSEKLFESLPDVVIHLAWSTYPATSEMQPGSEWITDLPNLVGLCRAISRLGASSRPQLLFMSTCAVYGDQFGLPCTEESVPCPKGWYARSKCAAESLISGFVASEGLHVTIIRASSVYGLSQDPNRLQGIIPKLISSSQSGDPCIFWGDGSARKDFLHIRDLISLLTIILEEKLTGTFNACSELSISLNELSELIEEIADRPLVRIFQPNAGWDVQHTLLSHSKARRMANWHPSISLRDGIAELASRMR